MKALNKTYRSFEAYSCSILHLWSTKWPYFSRKSIPFCVWLAMESYWSWNKENKVLWNRSNLKRYDENQWISRLENIYVYFQFNELDKCQLLDMYIIWIELLDLIVSTAIYRPIIIKNWTSWLWINFNWHLIGTI